MDCSHIIKDLNSQNLFVESLSEILNFYKHKYLHYFVNLNM